MSRALYTFNNKEDNQLVDVVEFDLLDNPGCRAWQYAVMLNNKARNTFQGDKSTSFTQPHNTSSFQYQQLKNTINDLSTTQFNFNHPVPESFDLVTQDFLNVLHRHFTNSCVQLWLPASNFNQLEKLNKLLQDLNTFIHNLESSIPPTENKLKYSQYKNEIWLTNSVQEFGYDISPFRQYHSYDPADLILDAYILGKSLLESFMGHDDPTSWDTSGHMKTNGGAIAILSYGRQEIYESYEFNNWLKDHNSTKQQRYADFPLGNFAPGHKDKLLALKQNLHKYSCQVSIQL